jgi:hypothetical protein
MTATAPRPWWRLNRWGIAALAVVVVIGAVPVLRPLIQQQWKQAHPVSAGAAGSVVYQGATIRVVGSSIRDGVPPSFAGGDPSPAPTGTEILALTLGFSAAAPASESLAGCKLTVLDSTGRRFDADGTGVIGVSQFGLCTPSDSTTDTSKPYSATSYFLLPSGTEPTSVEVQIGVTDRSARLSLSSP